MPDFIHYSDALLIGDRYLGRCGIFCPHQADGDALQRLFSFIQNLQVNAAAHIGLCDGFGDEKVSQHHDKHGQEIVALCCHGMTGDF